MRWKSRRICSSSTLPAKQTTKPGKHPPRRTRRRTTPRRPWISCDPDSIIIDVKKDVLKNGGIYRIRASLKGMRDGMNILNVVNGLRYFSSDASVATASETGKIRVSGAGTCTVYILANNGVRTSLEVRVK